jgi:hypothetical protein
MPTNSLKIEELEKKAKWVRLTEIKRINKNYKSGMWCKNILMNILRLKNFL